jgi:hypothetical protein
MARPREAAERREEMNPESVTRIVSATPALTTMVANMTLRDWYAGVALQGLINYGPWSDEQDMKRIARCAHLQADAMMAEREKK